MQAIKDNAALLITVLVTILIGAVGIAVLASSSSEPLTEEEKGTLLVREDSITTGKLDSEITIVEFSDFECSACAYYEQEFSLFKQNYQDRVKFVYRHFPLTTIHPLAETAAQASEAARAQGKFWEYHDTLFEKQPIWSLLSEEQAREAFVQYARDIEIDDIEKFETELNDGTYLAKVQADSDDAKALKLSGTPTVFLNGEQVSDRSYDGLVTQVDKLLGQAE